MSHRAAGGAQSKLSKTEKKGEGKGREATPLVTNEIVPGRLNESEWSLLLDRDEGQDFAAEVVAEVVEAVIGISYDSYLDIAVIPYTVDHFQVLLEEVVEAEFPICDVGEPLLASDDVDVIVSNADLAGREAGEAGGKALAMTPHPKLEDASWLEDAEPLCGITDSWAQGSVPVQKSGADSRTASRISVLVEEEHGLEEMAPDVDESDRIIPTRGTPLGQGVPSDPVVSADANAITCHSTSPCPPKFPWEGKSGKSSTRARRKLKKKPPDEISSSLVSTSSAPEGTKAPTGDVFLSNSSIHSQFAPLLPRYSGAMVKAQNGRPPGFKDITYDELGNVVGVARIDPDSLPDHRIKTRVTFTAAASEFADDESSSRLSSRLRPNASLKPARLASIGSKFGDGCSISPPPIPSMPTLDDIVFPLASSQYGTLTTAPDSSAANRTTLIDHIQLSPGVVVRDGEKTKAGPDIPPPDTSAFMRLKESGNAMQPVQSHPSSNFTIKDMVDRRTPTLRPFHDKHLLTTGHYGAQKK